MYIKAIKPFGLFLLLAIAGLFTSCQKEDTLASDADNFATLSTRGVERGPGGGLAGCYELVFPVTIQLPDSTFVEVGDYDALKQALHDWYIANGGHPHHFHRIVLVYPVQIINLAGDTVTVETPEAMRELIALCRPDGGGHHGGGDPDTLGGGHHGGGGHDSIGGGGHHGGPCFTLVFPLTISFPDSSQVTVNSQKEIQLATITWNQNNPGQHGHPEFVFPITVTMRDGTQVVVNSKEELRALKESCRG